MGSTEEKLVKNHKEALPEFRTIIQYENEKGRFPCSLGMIPRLSFTESPGQRKRGSNRRKEHPELQSVEKVGIPPLAEEPSEYLFPKTTEQKRDVRFYARNSAHRKPFKTTKVSLLWKRVAYACIGMGLQESYGFRY